MGIKGRLIAASSSNSPDILYASSFSAPDLFIYFAAGKEKGVLVSTLEHSRALKEVKRGVTVYNRVEFSRNPARAASNEEVILELSKRKNVSTWQVPADFPVFFADYLRKNGIAIEPVQNSFFPERCVKKKNEVKLIKEVQKITESSMALAVKILGESSVNSNKELVYQGEVLTSEIMRMEIETHLKRHGASAVNTIIACGTMSSEPHNHGHGPIYAGKPIVFDIFPRSDSSFYWGDMTRTFVKGKAPARIKKAFEAVRDARNIAQNFIKAGISGAAAHQKASDYLSAKGFPSGRKGNVYYGFIHGLGHGVGLEIHEEPRLSPLNKNELKAGYVVTVEPGLYYPDWGGIRMENLGLVLEDGFESFNVFPDELEIP